MQVEEAVSNVTLEMVSQALASAQRNLAPGTEAHQDVSRALAEIGKIETGRAVVGTSYGCDFRKKSWTFLFEGNNFRPGVGQYYIIPATINVEDHPPPG